LNMTTLFDLSSRIKCLEIHEDKFEIPVREQVVVITYPATLSQEEVDKLWEAKKKGLKTKHGRNFSENDFLFVGIKKFGRQ